MSRLIALTGRALAGKDTVAAHLCAAHGFTVVRFSGPLKRLVADAFGWSVEDLDDQRFKETPDPRWLGPDGQARTPREILQHLGCEGFRAIDPDYWVKRARHSAERLLRRGQAVVIPDCRFPNEAQMVWDLRGDIWQVRRPGGPRTAHGDHESEQAMHEIGGIDEVLWNQEGQQADMLARADELLGGA